jgi:hypothetical protein
MKRKALILSALAYRRHTGASLGDIRSFVSFRQDAKGSLREDRAILSALEAEGTVYKVGRRWFLTPAAYQAAKGPTLSPEWESYDAWILLAVLYSRGRVPAALDQIVGVADFINHAIPTAEEMHGALNRLTAGGLVKYGRDGATPTKKGSALYEKVAAVHKRYALDQLDGLRRMMECPSCGVRLRRVRWAIPLDRQTYDEAVARYLGSSP